MGALAVVVWLAVEGLGKACYAIVSTTPVYRLCDACEQLPL